MKIIRTLAVAFMLLTPFYAKNVPTPDMAISFNMNRDPKKWDGQLVTAEEWGFIFEFVPHGETTNTWTEMVEQQIGFTPTSLRNYVDVWKAGMLRADTKIVFNEQTRKDGSLVVAYASATGQEISVRRFIKGNDGIYMLAYLVRPKSRDDSRLNIWIDIIDAAELVHNPNKK
jgi:hypothetical protein